MTWIRKALVVTMAMAACVALAQQDAATPPSDRGIGLLSGQGEPINIVADRLDADNKSRKVLFSGNVTAVQGDAVMLCDELEIHYTPEGGDISRAVARGNVRMNQKDRRAICTTATYVAQTGTVLLTGDPEVWQGMDHLAGKEVLIYLDEDRVEVTGDGESRVRVTIFPEENKQKEAGQQPG